jgi:NAD(P)-dependent dehydrogenase (short-subunit alcohol dehydrogenase family)
VPTLRPRPRCGLRPTSCVRNSSDGVSVTALHIGFMDTDMVANIDAVKADPAIIAGIALDGTRASVAHAPANDDPICRAEPPDSAGPLTAASSRLWLRRCRSPSANHLAK